MQVSAYFTFNGNCRQAMNFYQKCLGGKLFFQTVGQSAFAEKMPKRMKNCILHATLSNGSFLLIGSDMVGENRLIRGNAVSLTLTCSSEKEIKSCYKKLSPGGQATHPPENTFRGALFGTLTDKYGNNWMLSYSGVQKVIAGRLFKNSVS
jgi:PhnB protein